MASSRGRRAASAAVVGLAFFLGGVSTMAGAGTATGVARATVVGTISSVPFVIRFHHPVAAESSAPGTPLEATKSPPFVSEASFGIALVGVDTNGVATFNVAGATTSSYVIQTSAAPNPGLAGLADPTGTYGAADSGQIFAAGTLTDGKEFAIAISQSSTSAGGEITVMVNYN
jgi:hypothetical protein